MNMLLSLAIAIKVVHILDGELNINGLRIPVRVDISQAAINAIKIKNLNTVMEILYNLMWLRYCGVRDVFFIDCFDRFIHCISSHISLKYPANSGACLEVNGVLSGMERLILTTFLICAGLCERITTLSPIEIASDIS